ncbi:hypothetical protein OSTOST_05464 [Ostertagia ostertagi]
MAEDDERDGRREAQVAGGRRRVVRRRVQHGEDDFINQVLGPEVPEDSEEEGAVPLLQTDEKIGKRKAAKLQAKAEKKAMREQLKESFAVEEEGFDQLEEEESHNLMKEFADYIKKSKLKESFAVEEEGFDQLEEEESHNLMKEFADYIKKSKVVNMDELAAHFGLKSEEAISRLQYFLDNGLLEGVMDDRGKFICITDEELNAVAKFINQRGRVTIQELAEYSNKLICLEGSA